VDLKHTVEGLIKINKPKSFWVVKTVRTEF